MTHPLSKAPRKSQPVTAETICAWLIRAITAFILALLMAIACQPVFA